jgi:hypothetical protein
VIKNWTAEIYGEKKIERKNAWLFALGGGDFGVRYDEGHESHLLPEEEGGDNMRWEWEYRLVRDMDSSHPTIQAILNRPGQKIAGSPTLLGCLEDTHLAHEVTDVELEEILATMKEWLRNQPKPTKSEMKKILDWLHRE